MKTKAETTRKPRGKNKGLPPAPPHCEALMTKADVCASLRIGNRTFQKMLAADEYPKGKPLGGVPRWRRADHDEWVRRFWGVDVQGG